MVPYALTDGLHRHPSLFVLMLFAGWVMMISLVWLFVSGFFATLRRGAYGWLVLGIVCSPLAYAVWAAITSWRIRAAAGANGQQAEEDG